LRSRGRPYNRSLTDHVSTGPVREQTTVTPSCPDRSPLLGAVVLVEPEKSGWTGCWSFDSLPTLRLCHSGITPELSATR
jgi:hypothetical protein